MEIKNKMTVTRVEKGEGQQGKKGKGRQGTCIKDPWTQPKRGRIEGGWEVGVSGVGESGEGKMETVVLEKQVLKKETLWECFSV